MKLTVNKDTEMAVLAGLALLVLYTHPLSVGFILLGAALAVYGVTGEAQYAMAVLGLALAYRVITDMRKGRQMDMLAEGFQAKNPLAVAGRIEAVRGEAPLQPKVVNPVGVLDSPDVLNNYPLQHPQELAAEGAPGVSTPAPAGRRILINPPAETTMPAIGTLDSNPIENPYLQSGPDVEGLQMAMVPNGTAMPAARMGSSDLPGTTAGPSPA
jgi:hypothetical protein